MKSISLFVAVGFLLACSSEIFGSDLIVKRIEEIATTYPILVDATEPEITAPKNDNSGYGIKDWYRRKIKITDVSYDVRKTDSLVSPFMGEILYTLVTSGRNGPSEKSATEGPDNFEAVPIKCKAIYAYQSSRWVRKSVTCLSYDNTWETPKEGTPYRAAELLPKE